MVRKVGIEIDILTIKSRLEIIESRLINIQKLLSKKEQSKDRQDKEKRINRALTENEEKMLIEGIPLPTEHTEMG
jgi:hypothetical protein